MAIHSDGGHEDAAEGDAAIEGDAAVVLGVAKEELEEETAHTAITVGTAPTSDLITTITEPAQVNIPELTTQ